MKMALVGGKDSEENDESQQQIPHSSTLLCEIAFYMFVRHNMMPPQPQVDDTIQPNTYHSRSVDFRIYARSSIVT